jgi:hypothetical protein
MPSTTGFYFMSQRAIGAELDGDLPNVGRSRPVFPRKLIFVIA